MLLQKDYLIKLIQKKMYLNCITSTVLASASIPYVVSNDKEAIQLCIKSCNRVDKNNIKLVRIANSIHIEYIMLSEVYYKDVLDGKYIGLEVL